jgi:hypothetical protein
MSKKASLPPRIARLQRVIAEPITDPAELAALDQVRKRLKRRGRQATMNRHHEKAASRSAPKKRA